MLSPSAMTFRPFLPLVLALPAFGCSVNAQDDSSAGQDVAEAPVRYLALGDSVAFGYDPNLPEDAAPTRYVGYPDELAKLLGLRVANAACSGEATGGFVDPKGDDNGCRDNRAKGHLHVRYDTTQL